MADQTFTSGQILTAAQMTALQANSGLVFVKSQAVVGTVASVVVTDAFSTTYDSYRIVYSGGTTGALTDILFWLGSTVSLSGYYGAFTYGNFSGGSPASSAQSNAANLRYMGISSTNLMSIVIEVNSPFQTALTTMSADCVYASTGGFAGRTSGFLNATTSFTTCSIAPASGSFTGGTIYVYGYRKA